MPPVGPGREIPGQWLVVLAVVASDGRSSRRDQLAPARHLGRARRRRRGGLRRAFRRLAAWRLRSASSSPACVLGLCSNLYARLTSRPVAVPLVPGLAALVPGALGFQGISAFLRSSTGSLEILAAVLVIAAGLVVGLLVADATLPRGTSRSEAEAPRRRRAGRLVLIPAPVVSSDPRCSSPPSVGMYLSGGGSGARAAWRAAQRACLASARLARRPARLWQGGTRGFLLRPHRRKGRRRHHRGGFDDRPPSERAGVPPVPLRRLAVAHPRRPQLRASCAPTATASALIGTMSTSSSRSPRRPSTTHEWRLKQRPVTVYDSETIKPSRPARHGAPLPHGHPGEDDPRAGRGALRAAQHSHPRRVLQGDLDTVGGARGRHHPVSAEEDGAEPQGRAPRL